MLKELMLADKTNTYVAPKAMILSEWLAYWMPAYVQDDVSANWYARKSDMIRIHIDPDIGRKKMQQLTHSDIKEFYRKLAKSGNKHKARNETGERAVTVGLSAGTIKHIHNILKAAFRQAVEDGIIGDKENPMKKVKAPKVVKRRIPKTLPKEDISKYLEQLSAHRLYVAFVLALGSGLRRGEVLGLYWTDIDMETGLLTVNTQLQRIVPEEGGSSLELTEVLKTDGSARSLYLPAFVLNELQAHKNRQEQEKLLAGSAYHNEGLVFCQSCGKRLDTRRLYELHCRALNKAGLEHIAFHDLRHTFATLLIERGENIKTVQELLGHADVSTTLNTYTHVLDKMKAASAARMDDVMAGCLPASEPRQAESDAGETEPTEALAPGQRLRLVVNNLSPREPDDRPEGQSRNHKVSDKVSK